MPPDSLELTPVYIARPPASTDETSILYSLTCPILEFIAPSPFLGDQAVYANTTMVPAPTQPIRVVGLDRWYQMELVDTTVEQR